MAWQDRLRAAAYTSPGGTRMIFDYEDVSESFNKKTTAFDFPDASGTYVQDTGSTGRKHPLRIFFWGDDYDLDAKAFMDLLAEIGAGELEHPIYGTVSVVPFDSITRKDNLKTGGNQAIIELTFWETIGLIYPLSENDPGGEVLTAVDEYNEVLAQEFLENVDIDSAVEQSAFLASYNSLLDSAESGLSAIAEVQADVEKQFNAINDSINRGINVLVSQPLTLAFQTVLLIQSPARALTSIQARLSAYGDLARSIVTSTGASTRDSEGNIVVDQEVVTTQGNGSTNKNDFIAKDLFASTYVTGSIVSTVNNTFVTRQDALTAAEAIFNQFEEVAAWRDENFESLDFIDQGASYQQLQEAVALTAGFLVQISFNLKQERIQSLDRSRTIVDLVYELYGSVDDQLDFFINSNNLTGSEILELPAGKEIAYYV